MSELKKSFSDFQQNECDTIPSADQSPQPIEAELCPTCVKDPSFRLEKYWWEIEKGYLHKQFCEYRVRITSKQIEDEYAALLSETSSSAEELEVDIDSDDEIKKLVGVRKLLIDFKKALTVDNIKSLKIVAQKIETQSPEASYLATLGEYYLISIPAFNFDQIPVDRTSTPRKTPEEAALTTPDIIIDVENFTFHWVRLLSALQTYEYFYRAAQHVDKDLVVVEAANPVNRISYQAAIESCEDFKNDLNNMLLGAGYAAAFGSFSGFFSQRVRKIKFVFDNKDGEPFGIQSVAYLPANGCTDYVEFEDFSALQTPEYNVVYNFLARIDIIIRDITAQETKPWLEFTLDHFYPQMVAQYGLEDVTEETGDELSCLLEKELGLDGDLLDSVGNEILSFMDVLANELQKEACRAIQSSFKGTPGYAADKKLEEERKRFELEQERKKAQLIKRYENDFKNQMLKDFVKYINLEYVDKPNADRRRAGRQDIIESVDKTTVIFKIRELAPIALRANVLLKDNFGTNNLRTDIEIQFAQNQDPNTQINDQAKILSLQKYENEKNKFLGNSPYLEDYTKAKLERYESGVTVLNEAKQLFKLGKGPNRNVLKEFTASFGLCGLDKLTGEFFKCLLGGVKIDDLLDKIVEVCLQQIEIDMFAILFAELPTSVKRPIQEEIRKQFGEIDLERLIKLALTDNPKNKLGNYMTTHYQAQEAMVIFEKYKSPLDNMTDDERTFLTSILTESNIQDISQTYNLSSGSLVPSEVNVFFNNETDLGGYDYTNNVYGNLYSGSDEEDSSSKNKKLYHKLIKYYIKKNKNAAVQRGLQRIGNFFVDGLSATFVDPFVRVWDSLKISWDVAGADWRAIKSDFLATWDTITFANVREARAVRAEFVEEMDILGAKLENDEIDFDLYERDLNRIKAKMQASLEALEGLQDAESERRKQQRIQTAEDQVNLRIQAAAALIPEGSKITDADQFEKATNSFKKEINPLGTKIDAVFDVIFDTLLDEMMDILGVNELFKLLKSYPVVDFVLGVLKDFQKKCPLPPLFYPPPDNFMKSFSIDVCDPTIQLTLPRIIIPSINFKYKFTEIFKRRFQEAIQQLIANILMKLVMGSLNGLESSLCKGLEAVGGFAIDAINNPASLNSFIEALDEAFCGGQTDEDGRSKAEKLAEKLLGVNSDDFVGMGNKITNIISGVASQNDFLNALVAEEGETDPRFETRVSEAIKLLAPEAAVLLGSPSQVGFFFRNLGSYLPADDKQRIRDLLASGVPNLPVSNSICLTNEQLDEWNKLRRDLLEDQGLTPEDARARVAALNNATLDVLGDLLTDIATLNSPEGPFVAPLLNILGQADGNNGNLKPMGEGSTIDDIYDNTESCNDNVNPIIQSRTPQQKEFEDKMTDSQFKTTERELSNLMMGPGGILGEAMRDTQGKAAFFHALSKFYSNLIPIGDKYVDADADYEGARETEGQYPPTVGIKLRDEILSKTSYNSELTDFEAPEIEANPISITFFDDIQTNPVRPLIPAKNINYPFEVGSDSYKYYYDVSATQNGFDLGTFNYRLDISEQLGTNQIETIDSSIRVPVSITEDESKYLRNIGFKLGLETPNNIRKEVFKKIIENKAPEVEINGGLLYDKLFETFNRSVLNDILSNPVAASGLPIGFQFGYSSEGKLSLEDFEYLNPDDGEPYNKREEEKVLGVFGNSRIMPLNPEVYGGRYTNPPIYIMPRDFTGWFDIKDRIFSLTYKGEYGVEGCDPKTPPIFNLKDIKDRVKKLDDQLKTDSRLAQDPDCVDVRPFAHLLNKKSHANLDGVVRMTIRTYVLEHFLRAFGLLSNLDYREQNYDSAFSQYVISKMKDEMIEQGSFDTGPIIRIVRSTYWYTFLEQSVQAYKRMEDIDGLVPPENIQIVLDELRDAVDLYTYPTSNTKNDFLVDDNNFTLPGKVPDIFEALADQNTFYRHAIAYRVYGENIFNSDTTISLPIPRVYSLKKIRFYSKIYFLRLVEEKSTIILSELVNAEFRRMMKNYSESPTTKPYIYDLKRHLFGMTSLFSGTTSRLGLRQYYIDKQAGVINTGTVPDIRTISELNSELQEENLDSEYMPKLVLEKYVKLTDKADQTIVPLFIKDRDGLRGKVKLEEFSDFIDSVASSLQGEKLSDCFGNLEFTYEQSILKVFKKGFTDSDSINEIKKLNGQQPGIVIDNALANYISSRDFTNFNVLIPKRMISDDENLTPSGTKGSIGVSFGLSISVFTMIEGGDSVKIELASSEVDVIDQELATFDPINGTQSYDLECLVNKMLADPEFSVIFSKLLNLEQISSMTAVYCSHGFAGSLGQGAGERVELEEPEVDDWDRTFNAFAKDFLRMQFGGHYLSNDFDNDTTEEDSRSTSLFSLLNPFAGFSLSVSLLFSLPWWRLSMIKTKVYDKNGVECANPLKDLQ